MNIIKLSATNSTNDYLKQLTATQHVDNFTIVVTENQMEGKGQMGAKWNAEPGKNLTFSILVRDLLPDVTGIFNLNVAVAVSIAQALEQLSIPALKIKWPNDILAGNKKIGGILIENSFKTGGEIFSVIGIGLNVNQKNFDGLPKASSLCVAAGRDFNKDEVMVAVVTKLQHNIARLMNNDTAYLWQGYIDRLYKIGVPMPFESGANKFMGIIRGVTPTGQLEVLLENDTTAHYAIKEVQLLY
ncbi:biotin--acetyl-CoA-carboxylase ligase [Flavobacterium rivuli WB 3.3-2 = DSM 21788]|uniref:Biotin--acetyl-CoA-carboxylase ligase n=1 Tax=Flavobacterium rivuli WB 3.3-2 = DSM 21788 TaxID=1121895 RepID=A0A0A2M2W1_9FLAO|nr:biotin--[acetyl-CoA-carboxylase] ligase [Flavobacterium rivuli]KGO86594.1 biotin--acetyl-CoA-carboxylase ligase [Flavobacterium rivuli WB 3.3-2 = DSM 21788]